MFFISIRFFLILHLVVARQSYEPNMDRGQKADKQWAKPSNLLDTKQKTRK